MKNYGNKIIKKRSSLLVLVFCLVLSLMMSQFGSIKSFAGDETENNITTKQEEQLEMTSDSAVDDSEEKTDEISDDKYKDKDTTKDEVAPDTSIKPSKDKKDTKKSIATQGTDIELEVTGVTENQLMTAVRAKLTSMGYSSPAAVFGDVTKLKISGKLKIDDYAYMLRYFGDNLENLDLSGLTNDSIPEAMIREYSKLSEVKLSPSIKKIERLAFFGSKVESINLENVEEIEEGAFGSSKIDIDPSTDLLNVRIMGKNSFALTGIQGELNLPNLTKLEHYAFWNTNLTKVNTLGTVDTIPASCFSGCTELESIYISSSVTTIGNAAFMNCSKLKDIKIDGIDKFEKRAFYNCLSLEKIDFPTSADYGEEAFFRNGFDFTNGFPNGTYFDGTPEKSFLKQIPAAHLTLVTTNASIGIEDTYDPVSIQTYEGTDFKDLIASNPGWLNSNFKMPNVDASPDPVECAKAPGVYTIQYSIDHRANKMLEFPQSKSFQLTVRNNTLTGGLVYKDIDANGVYDSSIDKKYTASDNLSIGLYKKVDSNWSSNPVKTVKVANDGSYDFTAVGPGTYRVKAIVGGTYISDYSAEFTARGDQDNVFNDSIGVQAKGSLKVEFYNQNDSKVGKTTEIYGSSKGFLNNFAQSVNVKALTGTTSSNRFEVSVPDQKNYKLIGGVSKSADFNWDNVSTHNQTLKFKLQGNTYTVTFNGNGATTGPSPQKMSVAYPDKITKFPNKPAKTGSTFSSWNTSPKGTGSTFSPSTPVTSNTTVYAKWVPNYYTLKYSLNGGSGTAPKTNSLKYGEKASKPSDPSRGNYDFVSWNTKKDGSGTTWKYSSSTMPAKNVTLYAQWKQQDPDNNGGGNTGGNNGGGNNGGTTTTPSTSPTNTGNQPPDSEGATTTEEVAPPDNYNDNVANNEEEPSNVAIGDSKVPLFGNTNGNTWSLLNMIMIIAGAMLAIITAAMILLNRRNQDTEFTGREYDFKWLIIGIGIAVADALVFVLSQDLNGQMVVLDMWSVVNTVLLSAQIVTSVLLLRGKSVDYDDAGDMIR